jgi:hypothetical protein
MTRSQVLLNDNPRPAIITVLLELLCSVFPHPPIIADWVEELTEFMIPLTIDEDLALQSELQHPPIIEDWQECVSIVLHIPPTIEEPQELHCNMLQHPPIIEELEDVN